jgi:DNA-binding response OmpR family regulator
MTHSERATVSVLLVEDDASMAKLVRHLLEMDGYRQIRHVYTGEQAVLAAREAEIVLLDHQLPDVRGIELLPRLLNRADPPAVIMVTGHGNESLAAAALRQGAEDYITKDHSLPELLPRILERVRRNRALQRALAEAEEDLVQAERVAAVGELNVTLRHELNNPLMAAMAETGLLLADPAVPPESREGLRTIQAALDRIAETLRKSAELQRTVSVPYGPGQRMLDLDASTGEHPVPPFLGTALIVHPDLRVARVLSLVLREAGFTVHRPLSVRDLQDAAEAPGITLVVIPSGTDPLQPLDGFTPAESHRYALVVLGTEHEARARAAGADRVIAMPFDPAAVAAELVEAVSARTG